MKVDKITYGKTINIGNYQSIKVEITLQAEDGELSAVIYEKAKKFVELKEKEILKENIK